MSKESDESQDKDDPPGDPEQEGPGKYYLPKTRDGKAVAKILLHIFNLLQCDANAIVMYYGVSSKKKMANF